MITAKFLVSDRFPRWAELEIDQRKHTATVDGEPVEYSAALDQLEECETCFDDGEEDDPRFVANALRG